MIRIDYPQHEFRTKTEGNLDWIFDDWRKRWVRLSPEEWVRQNFLQYLVKVAKYPAALIAVEKEIYVGELKKRFDILVYDDDHQPWMLVECKAMEVALTEEVLNQVLRYSITIPSPFILITNGHHCVGWKKTTSGLTSISILPGRSE